MDRIKLLVVDDSIFFRELMSRYIQQDASIEIVGKAGDAYSARDMILQYEPDVMTLDLEIPRMDGIAFLKRLLPQYYIPSILISTSEARRQECLEAGAVEFLKKPVARTNNDMAAFASQLCATVRRVCKKGGVSTNFETAKPVSPNASAMNKASETLHKVHDTLNKPIEIPQKATETFHKVQETLNKPIEMPQKATETLHKVQETLNKPIDFPKKPAENTGAKPAAASPFKQISEAAAKAEKTVMGISHGIKQTIQPEKHESTASQTVHTNRQKLKKSEALIALGASTGGTEALEQVIKLFPADTPPVVIVQHMPAGFTKMYSERLNRTCAMEVKEAVDGERLHPGLIVIAAGDHQLRVCKDPRGWYISSKPGEKVSGHCPSVDVMFSSVAEAAGRQAIGAILTGMGHDGANGLLKMRQAGAFTIGQDRDTCVVYGMPMEAYKIGAVEVQAPLYKIADIILSNLV